MCLTQRQAGGPERNSAQSEPSPAWLAARSTAQSHGSAGMSHQMSPLHQILRCKEFTGEVQLETLHQFYLKDVIYVYVNIAA